MSPEVTEKLTRVIVLAFTPLLLAFAARFIWLGWQRLKKGQQ